MDLRRPEGYFHRLWNIGFRPADLARGSRPIPRADAPFVRLSGHSLLGHVRVTIC